MKKRGARFRTLFPPSFLSPTFFPTPFIAWLASFLKRPPSPFPFSPHPPYFSFLRSPAELQIEKR